MATAMRPSRLSVHRFRADLAAVLGRVRDEGAFFVVTRRGRAIAAVVPVGSLDLIRAAAGPFAERDQAAAADVHDLATAATDVTPGTDSAPFSPGPSARPAVPDST